MDEDLVDDRRLDDEGDHAPRAEAGRARQRVDLEDLLEEHRPHSSLTDRTPDNSYFFPPPLQDAA